jgi:hypothetical protein
LSERREEGERKTNLIDDNDVEILVEELTSTGGVAGGENDLARMKDILDDVRFSLSKPARKQNSRSRARIISFVCPPPPQHARRILRGSLKIDHSLLPELPHLPVKCISLLALDGSLLLPPLSQLGKIVLELFAHILNDLSG